MKIRSSLLLLIPVLFVMSCNKDSNSTDILGNWIKKSSFDGAPRRDAVAFAIGSRAFIGTGYDGIKRMRDFWEYDAVSGQWNQKASLPDSVQVGPSWLQVPARNGAVAFGTDTKGYVGCGTDGVNALNDFYEYDPVNNTWSVIAPLGTTNPPITDPDIQATFPRSSAVSFSINNIGYVCTGYTGTFYLKDLWAYDPATGYWTKKASYGGEKRTDAVAFVINDTAYVCTGIDNGNYLTDFYAYVAATDTWIKKRDIANVSPDSYDDGYDIKRIKAVAFTMNHKGYIATGATSSVLNTCWEYDPSTDLWTYKNLFEGAARADAIALTVNNVGYVATGASNSYYFDDIWAFAPNDVLNTLDKK
jgi:N-acetylneuraminic acid mutarotase